MTRRFSEKASNLESAFRDIRYPISFIKGIELSMNRFQEFDEGDFTDKTVLDQLNASFLPKCRQEVARYLN